MGGARDGSRDDVSDGELRGAGDEALLSHRHSPPAVRSGCWGPLT